MSSYCSMGCQIRRGSPGWGLQSVAGYLGLALLFVWGAHRGGDLVTVFRGVFGSAGEFLFWRGSGHWAIILWGLGTFLIFPNFLRS